MTRLPVLDLDEIPEEYHYLFTDDYLGDRHIFRVWAHNPAVLEGTLEYLDLLYEQLGTRRKELIILVVARDQSSRYEWHQHVDIARGHVSIEEMRRIGGGDLSGFGDEEYVLLQYAKAVSSGSVTDEIHEALTRYYSNAEIVVIGLLVDFYVGLCNHITSVDLSFEGGEFVGWTPDAETVSELFA